MQITISNAFKRFYRLGVWYGIYRLLIACALLAIFFLTLSQAETRYLDFYLLVVFFYTLINIFQLIALLLRPRTLRYIIISFISIDILAFSLISFIVGSTNLHISLLFVTSIFISNLLIRKKTALTITLIAIISVTYAPFVGSWFRFATLDNLTNSMILTAIFLAVYSISQFVVKHFQVLQQVNKYQSLELTQLQDLNRYILEQTDMGYLILNENRSIILINPAAQSLLNIPTTVLTQRQPLSLIHESLNFKLQQKNFFEGERFLFEQQIPEGQVNIDIRVQKLTVPRQQLTLLIMQDAKRLNQHVQQLKLAALGQLSASIAHEIRNPLSSIVQANELTLGSDYEQQQMLQQMIEKQSQRINKIIQSTLEMARHTAPEPTHIHLKTFINTLLKEDLSDIQDQILLDLDTEIAIYFDELHLRQILINLLRNAIRHNAKNHRYIKLQASIKHNSAMIDVLDFGVGISALHAASLFDPFFTTEPKGTGLGLYLSRSLCEANQATLSYSRQDNTTCFRIECPLAEINI